MIFPPLFERVFGDELGDEILEIAKRRLLDGTNLARRGCDRRRAKLALLIVIQINPKEVLTRSEAAILYNISETTLRNGYKELENKVNL